MKKTKFLGICLLLLMTFITPIHAENMDGGDYVPPSGADKEPEYDDMYPECLSDDYECIAKHVEGVGSGTPEDYKQAIRSFDPDIASLENDKNYINNFQNSTMTAMTDTLNLLKPHTLIMQISNFMITIFETIGGSFSLLCLVAYNLLSGSAIEAIISNTLDAVAGKIFNWNDMGSWIYNVLILVAFVSLIRKVMYSMSRKGGVTTTKNIVNMIFETILSVVIVVFVGMYGRPIIHQIETMAESSLVQTFSFGENDETLEIMTKDKIFNILQMKPFMMRHFGTSDIDRLPINDNASYDDLHDYNTGRVQKILSDPSTANARSEKNLGNDVIMQGIGTSLSCVVYSFLGLLHKIISAAVLLILTLLLGVIRLFKEILLFFSILGMIVMLLNPNHPKLYNWFFNRFKWMLFSIIASILFSIFLYTWGTVMDALAGTGFILAIIFDLLVLIAIMVTWHFKDTIFEKLKDFNENNGNLAASVFNGTLSPMAALSQIASSGGSSNSDTSSNQDNSNASDENYSSSTYEHDVPLDDDALADDPNVSQESDIADSAHDDVDEAFANDGNTSNHDVPSTVSQNSHDETSSIIVENDEVSSEGNMDHESETQVNDDEQVLHPYNDQDKENTARFTNILSENEQNVNVNDPKQSNSNIINDESFLFDEQDLVDEKLDAYDTNDHNAGTYRTQSFPNEIIDKEGNINTTDDIHQKEDESYHNDVTNDSNIMDIVNNQSFDNDDPSIMDEVQTEIIDRVNSNDVDEDVVPGRDAFDNVLTDDIDFSENMDDEADKELLNHMQDDTNQLDDVLDDNKDYDDGNMETFDASTEKVSSEIIDEEGLQANHEVEQTLPVKEENVPVSRNQVDDYAATFDDTSDTNAEEVSTEISDTNDDIEQILSDKEDDISMNVEEVNDQDSMPMFDESLNIGSEENAISELSDTDNLQADIESKQTEQDEHTMDDVSADVTNLNDDYISNENEETSSTDMEVPYEITPNQDKHEMSQPSSYLDEVEDVIKSDVSDLEIAKDDTNVHSNVFPQNENLNEDKSIDEHPSSPNNVDLVPEEKDEKSSQEKGMTTSSSLKQTEINPSKIDVSRYADSTSEEVDSKSKVIPNQIQTPSTEAEEISSNDSEKEIPTLSSTEIKKDTPHTTRKSVIDDETKDILQTNESYNQASESNDDLEDAMPLDIDAFE